MQNEDENDVLVLKHGSDVYQVTDGNGDFDGALAVYKNGDGDIITEFLCEKQCPVNIQNAGAILVQDVETADYLFNMGAPECTIDGNWDSYAVHDGSVNEWPRLLIAWSWTENGIAGKITIAQPQA